MTIHTHVPPRHAVTADSFGVSVFGEPAVPSDPDVGFFLSIPNAPGGATTKGFEGQIELLTWAWGVDSTTSVGAGGGGGAGKANPRPVLAVCESGIQSPPLLLAANTGMHSASAVISCVRIAKKPFTFMTLELEDVLVTTYAVTPDPTHGHPLDLIHLVFARLTQTFVPQKADGSVGTPVTTSFDYQKNATT